MCGRYALAFVHGFKTRFEIMDMQAKVEPRFNIAPTENVPVIIGGDGNRSVDMRWGLIPFWSKDMKIGNRLINARGETITKRPAFRAAAKRRRCLIPATGFYEWKKTEAQKIPYYIHMKEDSLFAFAGLYEHWKSPEDQEVLSCTIVTSKPNEVAGKLHNRMPVILARDQENVWIRDGALSDSELQKALKPYPAQEMEAHIVSIEINNPRNEGEHLIEPVLRAHAKL